MIQKLIILFAIICSASVYASPAPLGIELGKTTLKDVGKLYKITQSEQNATKGYYNNFLDIKDIDISTVSRVNVISNKEKIVEAVTLELDKDQFNSISGILSKKYKVLEHKVPVVGNKFITLQDGKCFIFIEALDVSNKMDVIYTTERFHDDYERVMSTEEQIQKENIGKLL